MTTGTGVADSGSGRVPRYASPVDVERFGPYGHGGNQGPSGWCRAAAPFRGRLTAGAGGFRAEPGRYHLYLSWGCGWAQRIAIARRLLGLERVLTLSYVDDRRDARGWAFRERRGADPVNGFLLLREAYEATAPGWSGHVSTPVLWDRHRRTIVSNDPSDLLVDLDHAFRRWSDPAVVLYPADLADELSAMDSYLYENVNDGVYRADGAVTQSDYDTWSGKVVGAFELLDGRLSRSRFLFGSSVTGSDIRLWTTLARFDLAYNPACGISERGLADFPNLWDYARDLYGHPAFRETTDFDTFRFPPPGPRDDGIVRRRVDPREEDWEKPVDRH
ncbi:glutathione S-transferase C-terminal domain-containing protein [Pseudonocardia nematodicida]|uniref:Glutathione S-transferase C-terminal domain-containing protein n=1 Tax=Pseudonocardia nematodicida TaxID=1206997 RepID=A0ABV1KEA4_9PSEU